jgi:Mn2+/Fe2+ NRAMP family transporter
VAVRKSLAAVVLWSVISAAFIGPGTVTTAASAGALYQLDLLWAVAFSTVACIVLQELSARLTIVTGVTMGQAIIRKHGERHGRWLNFLLGGPVILGCAAYEAGNILGAVSGLQLLLPGSAQVLTFGITVIVIFVLWTDRRETIGWIMTALVGVMGIAFAVLAYGRPFSFFDYVEAATLPRIPAGAELLTLGLVGTTIVPYNVFLGSAVSKGQTLHLMRVGLSISVVIGGLITMAILLAGTSVSSFTSFQELSEALQRSLGPVGALSLGAGLFAAGFSSAITSPFAASVIATSVFGWDKNRQRLVWAIVVLSGFAVGISGVKPIPVILLVQALNGLVLPLLTAFLILLANDSEIVAKEHRPSVPYKVVLVLIFASVLVMGMHSLDKSVSAWLGLAQTHFGWISGITFFLTAALAYRLHRQSRN